LQLADGLKAIPYGIELSEDRAAIVRESLPEGQSLCPADFLRCQISTASFSLAFVNPPYDYATGGEGRVEMQFLERAARLVADDGVMCLVCPEDVADWKMGLFFDRHFDRVSALPFPEHVRKYTETIVLGRKRKKEAEPRYEPRYVSAWLEQAFAKAYRYDLPKGDRPRTWRKSEPTDTECARLVAKSPLRHVLDPPTVGIDYRPRPPLSPGIGHRAMLLASGFIDGLIRPHGERPHVIRGSATKEEYVSASSSEEDANGNVTTRTVTSERPKLVIRVLDADGAIGNLE
jgi:hypothetical protein